MTTNLPRLAEVLRHDRDAIIEAWDTAGCSASSLRGLNRRQLRDEFSALLVIVADAAEHPEGEIPQDHPNRGVLQEVRLRVGIEEFVREYTLLKSTAFARLHAAVGPLDGEQALRLGRGFDRVLLEFVTVYARSGVQFTSVFSHDLRSPLQAIVGAAALLQRQGSNNAQQSRLVASILSSGKRASRLVNDMLEFSQIRLGGLSIRPEDTDLHALARDVVNEVKLGHPERRIKLECKGEGRGRWDAGRIAQVMTNLLRNAAHYSPPRTVIRMTIRDLGDTVELTVHNSGPPIAEELRPYLFLPLVGGIGQDRPGGGLGLGLFIVKRIVTASGGTVDLHSTEAEGTTFTVTLPRLPIAD